MGDAPADSTVDASATLAPQGQPCHGSDDSAESSPPRAPGKGGVAPWLRAWMSRYDDCFEPAAALRADALDLLATSFVEGQPGAGGARPPGPELVVHVELAALEASGPASPPPLARFHDGPAIDPEVARRLGCDAVLRRLLTDADGRVLNLGRRTRTVSPALRRALALRDQGCRFPGCTQRHRLHAHHIEHWADGGETRLGNLTSLCSRHHHLVHEGGYRVSTDEHGEPVFHAPGGQRIDPAPDDLPSTRLGVAGLEAYNTRDHGSGSAVSIDADTADCLWTGERLELNQALMGLQSCDGALGY